MPYSYQQVHEAAKGRWIEILSSAGFAPEHFTGKAMPCPNCSTGDGDRFNFTDFKKTAKEEGQIGWAYCRGRGCGSGSGWHWLEKMLGLKGQEAWEYVAKYLGIPELKAEGASITKEVLKSEIIIPVPENALKLINKNTKSIRFYNKDKDCKFNSRFYDRQYRYLIPYYNEGNEFIGFASRFYLKNGKKVTPIISYQRFENNDIGWSEARLPEPRPLFGLNSLQKDGTVYLVEGEKCQMKLKQLIGSNVITWTCGAGAWKIHNWEPLKNRDIVFVPDCDRYGFKYMFEIAKHLNKPYKAIIFKNREKKKGYDVADAIEEGLQKEQFFTLALQAKHYVSSTDQDMISSLADSERDLKESKKNTPIQIDVSKPPDESKSMANEMYKALGHDDERYYFYSREFKGIKSFTRNGFTSSGLLELNTDINHWRLLAPKGERGGSVDLSLAASILMKACGAKGFFSPEKIRRRGVFYDRDRVVVNLGDKIYIDGEEVDPLAIDSKYIYVNGHTINLDINDIANDDEGEMFLDLFRSFDYGHPAEAYLLAGWTMLAGIGGALEYRPNIWINAAMKSGKSFLINNTVMPVLGDFCMALLGGTSEAGIRQKMKGDCIPILFDESEAKNDAAKQKMESILDLMRNQTYDNKFQTLKGGKDGQAIAYTLKSMFLFSSISLSVSDAADRSRLAIVNLINPPAKTVEEITAKNKKFTELRKAVSDLKIHNIGHKFLARAISLVKEIRINAEIFAEAIHQITGDRRLGDQYGSLMAGVYAYTNDDFLNVEQAKTCITDIYKIDLKAYENLSSESDEINIFQTLMQYRVGVHLTAGFEYVTVGEMLEGVKKAKLDITNKDAKKYRQTLANMGILYKPCTDLERANGAKVFVYVATRSPSLAKIFRDTAAQSNWDNYLKRLPFAERNLSESLYFGTAVNKQRAVMLEDSFVGENKDII